MATAMGSTKCDYPPKPEDDLTLIKYATIQERDIFAKIEWDKVEYLWKLCVEYIALRNVPTKNDWHKVGHTKIRSSNVNPAVFDKNDGSDMRIIFDMCSTCRREHTVSVGNLKSNRRPCIFRVQSCEGVHTVACSGHAMPMDAINEAITFMETLK